MFLVVINTNTICIILKSCHKKQKKFFIVLRLKPALDIYAVFFDAG